MAWDSTQTDDDSISPSEWNNMVTQIKASSKSSPSFGTFLIDSSGAKSVNNLGFEPSRIKFESAIPIDGLDTEFAGTGNGNTEDNFAGTMIGFADNNGKEQVMCTGGSGNSINAIRAYASSSHCIGCSYGDQNANEIAEITATMSSFDSDGFTINVDTYSSVANINGMLVMYTAWE